MISVQRKKNVTLVLGTPSEERDSALIQEIKTHSTDGVPLFILDIKGTIVPRLLEEGIPFAAVSALEEVPSTGVCLVINDGHGYLSLAISHRVDLNPSMVIATVDVSNITPL